VGIIKRNRSLLVVIMGAVLVATSGFWEYVRMRPDYRYALVEPWSMRGFEMTMGVVIGVIGAALILLALPLSTRRIGESIPTSIAVAAASTLFATLLAVLADPREIQVGAIGIWGLGALVGAGAAVLTLKFLLPRIQVPWQRFAVRWVIFLGVTALAALLIFNPIWGSGDTQLWPVVLVAMVLLSIIWMIREPIELSAYRMLITGTVLALVVSLVSSGAARSTMLNEHLNAGIATDYRDIQITSGLMVAWLGSLLAFAGAVALWAKRRDQLEARRRASAQLEVAQESAQELGEAVTA
jgi:hypothetical protein